MITSNGEKNPKSRFSINRSKKKSADEGALFFRSPCLGVCVGMFDAEEKLDRTCIAKSKVTSGILRRVVPVHLEITFKALSHHRIAFSGDSWIVDEWHVLVGATHLSWLIAAGASMAMISGMWAALVFASRAENH